MGGYWPGHEATGPNQSLRQFALALGDRLDISVIGRDRPFGEGPALAKSEWEEEGFMRVFRVSPGRGLWLRLRQILLETPHDLLWLNGFHDPEFTFGPLLMRRSGIVPRRPTLLSTRGELAAGAVGLKPVRKRAYARLLRAGGLLSDVWLHTTGPGEAEDARRAAPYAQGVMIAPNVRLAVPGLPRESPPDDRLRLTAVGRITEVKNVVGMIEMLRSVTAPIRFEIYGPTPEEAYWRVCEAAISKLPDHIDVKRFAAIPNEEIPQILARTDLFISMTLGENFGHAIFEALSSGVPVLISDRTPWRDLQSKRAGWDVPIDRPEEFARLIDRYAARDDEERSGWREGARRVASDYLELADAEGVNLEMIKSVIEVRTA